MIMKKNCFKAYSCQSLRDDSVFGTLIGSDIICLGERYTPVLWDGEDYPHFVKTSIIRKFK